MRGSKLICFFFFVLNFLTTLASPTSHSLCRPDQRDALLEFKSEFRIQEPKFFDNDSGLMINVTSYPKTVSWRNDSDCCSWDGVMCDVNSGEVVKLDLGCSCLHGSLKSKSRVFSLRNLRVLNLAFNDFVDSTIPHGFGELMGLTQLNLSTSSLSGQIPSELMHLTKLVSLDLASNNLLHTEKSFLTKLARNLTNLRELDLSFVDISSGIPQDFLNLSSLRSLRLNGCNLLGRFPSNVLRMPRIQSVSLEGNPELRGHLPEFEVNSSLVTLDLSFTSFSGHIPDSIGNLKHLNALALGGCHFSGKIPSSTGNLTYLTSLELYHNNFTGEIPSSISNLKRLTELFAVDNKLSGDIPFGILNLTKLSFVALGLNLFTGSLPSNISVLSNLKIFDAGHNSLVGSFPPSLLSIPTLTSVKLEGNRLSGNVDFANVSSSSSKLQYLYLGGNNFSGPIPTSASELVNLQVLDLSNWNTGTSVDFTIFSHLKSLQYLDLSYLNTTTSVDLTLFSSLCSLSRLYLSGNHLVSIAVLDFPKQLEYLQLSDCSITQFPEFLRTQQNFSRLDISNNKIQGEVPDWLWRLPYLRYVNLSRNSFSGFQVSSPRRRYAATQLYTVDLSSNAFQGPLFIPSQSTLFFLASGNNFTGEIPQSICELSSLEILDLSDNSFNGSVPLCLGNLRQNSLSILNLRRNQLSGSLPDIFNSATSLTSLDVSHNRLVGKLPRSLINCTHLQVLNVESNRFKDTFPFWLQPLQELQVLVIRSNEFHGPMYFPGLAFGFSKLRILDISHNHFTGTLPSGYFANWGTMSLIGTSEDGSRSMYMGDFFGYYHDSVVLMNKGLEMEFRRILKIFAAVDLSGNELGGQIPESIGLLKGLHVLNLSNNAFTGHIPTSLANLTVLESLDLSLNKLSGNIPSQLGRLSTLAYMNFSHNQLVGPIPQGTQFQTQNASSFKDNLRLCGPPLDQSCGEVDAPKSQQSDAPELEEEEEGLSWIAAAIGFAPGILFGLTIGHLVASYKREWFTKISGRTKRRSTRTR